MKRLFVFSSIFIVLKQKLILIGCNFAIVECNYETLKKP